MIRLTFTLLVISSLVSLLYPLWGVFDPESFRSELAEDYVFDEATATSQISQASYWLFLPHSLFSAGLCFLTLFLSQHKTKFAYLAGSLIALTPLAQIFTAGAISLTLTSHTSDPTFAIELSSVGVIYLLFGLAIIAITKSTKA